MRTTSSATAFRTQVFQQVVSCRGKTVCPRVDEHFVFPSLHHKAHIRADNLIQGKIVIAEAPFQLFLRDI